MRFQARRRKSGPRATKSHQISEAKIAKNSEARPTPNLVTFASATAHNPPVCTRGVLRPKAPKKKKSMHAHGGGRTRNRQYAQKIVHATAPIQFGSSWPEGQKTRRWALSNRFCTCNVIPAENRLFRLPPLCTQQLSGKKRGLSRFLSRTKKVIIRRCARRSVKRRHRKSRGGFRGRRLARSMHDQCIIAIVTEIVKRRAPARLC